MKVDFKGYGENVATFICDDTVESGNFVKMSGDYKVTACSEGDDFIGLCINARDNYAAIQLAGYVEVVKTSDIQLGYQGLVTSSANTISQSDTASKKYKVISIDNKIGFIL